MKRIFINSNVNMLFYKMSLQYIIFKIALLYNLRKYGSRSNVDVSKHQVMDYQPKVTICQLLRNRRSILSILYMQQKRHNKLQISQYYNIYSHAFELQKLCPAKLYLPTNTTNRKIETCQTIFYQFVDK